MTDRVLRFGQLALWPERGQLLHQNRPVKLGSRALAILILLAERPGEIFSARDIVDHVWPNLFVQDNNLRVHLTAIRRVLRSTSGDQVEIINVPGRGYRLRGEVTIDRLGAAAARAAGIVQPMPLPIPANLLIGRMDCVASVLESLDHYRLVTIIGAGGIGKTSLALAALSAASTGTACAFIDLSNCTSLEHVTAAVSAALQSPMGNAATPSVIIDSLRDAEIVMLLDNCEHILGIIAGFAEALLQACPRIRILATSREPLRIPGEFRIPLPPLAVPDIADSVEAISISPAVGLFVQRAQESAGGFSLGHANARSIASICRSLDGLPLALELAAAAVPVLGIDALDEGLAQRLSLLSFGRRTLARHESLEAMLDWSFELLSPRERQIFSYLGYFRSSFDLASAVRIASAEPDEESDTAKAVLQLAAKSLVMVDTTSSRTTYRLLETTKVYARRKLGEGGAMQVVAQRHARWVQDLLGQAQDDWSVLERGAWWERYGNAIDDVRAALAWSLGDTGEGRLGVSLTLASAPLWIGLAQFAEYNEWLEKALSTLARLGEAGGAAEIQLQIGRCVLLFNAERPGANFVEAATRVLQIGEAIGDRWACATGLWLLSGYRQIVADYAGALALAHRISDHAAPEIDPELENFARRVTGLMTLRTGRLAQAEAIGAQLLADLDDRTAYDAVLRYDHSVVTRGHHALTLALRGRCQTALGLVAEAVAEGARLRNPATFCYLLISAACPIALWLGENALAKSYIDTLAREAADNGFTYMGELAEWYRRILDQRGGDGGRSGALPESGPLLPHDRIVFITLCPGVCDAQSLAIAEAGETHWASAEILRAGGEARLAAGDAAGALSLFSRSLAIAEAQGNWLWALRAATSLAPFMAADGAAAMLSAAVARFEHPHGQFADLRAARLVLAELDGQNHGTERPVPAPRA